jgi:2,4-dienoyl-CoA reductase (NADPH2)
MKKLGVKVELGKAATVTMVKGFKPEAAVVATGSVPIIPEACRGKGPNIVTALEVLGGHKDIQERVAVVGGGRIGCEVAEFLSERYKDVIILEMLEEIGNDIGLSLRPTIIERLKAAGIQIETGIRIVEITEKGIGGLRNGKSEFFNAGTIVIAVGMKSERRLVEEVQGIVPEMHVVGDCIEPRKIREAITDGYSVGLKL